jgi:leucyl aminopeptidase
MQFTVAAGNAADGRGEMLVIPVFEDSLSDNKAVPSALRSADARLGGLLLASAAREGFRAKAGKSWTFHTHGKLRANQVLLLGLGARAKFDLETLRLAAGRAAKAANKARAVEIAFALPSGIPLEDGAKAAVEGLALGAYRFDRYRTMDPDESSAPRLEQVQILLPVDKFSTASIKRAVEVGQKIADATNWARNLVDEPAGVLTPTRLADEARKAAEASSLKVWIGGRKQIQKLKMGMFLGVAQGSAEKPKLIRLSYVPKIARNAQRPSVALVGKAITFDSGGLSLKTVEGMVDMKTDMAGSAAVLAAMKVIGELRPPFPVHAFIGACENMPSGTAYRPGDILISRSGKTVEVTNTDAEGRLVLGDVLTWANEHKPAAIIDLATLTGACMIALGHYITGVFGNDGPLTRSVLAAAERAGEQAWELPISDLQKDALRSEVADMKNSGERWGGAINAAIFLREFVGNTPWVHLDIAGPSTSPKERGYFSKGATGVGVRTLVEFIRRRASTSPGPRGKRAGH